MKILILGSSKVGRSLACELVDEGHDVTVVGEDRSALKNMQQTMDIRTIVGRPSYPDILRSARADKTDIMIAVTDSDEVNMIACQAAYSLFQVPLKIAKIRSQHYLARNELFGNENLPVDIFLSPEILVAKSIFELITHSGCAGIYRFKEEKTKLITLKITDESYVCYKSWGKLVTILDSVNAKPVALMRQGKYIGLRSNIKIQNYDEVFIYVKDDDSQKMLELLELQKPRFKIKKIIIAGGGGVGACLSKLLIDYGCNVKIIDHDPMVCSHLAASISKATVLEGDASERNLLFQENVEGVDVFCALTSDDEDNIISSLQAKYLGARRVLSLVNNTEYMEIFSRSDLDVFVPPQQITISQILTYIRQSFVSQVYTLCRGVSEAVSLQVLPNRARGIVGISPAKIKFPKSVVFVGLYRNQNLLMSEEDTVQLGDSLLFFLHNKNSFTELAVMFD